jgi:penicillin amidase
MDIAATARQFLSQLSLPQEWKRDLAGFGKVKEVVMARSYRASVQLLLSLIVTVTFTACGDDDEWRSHLATPVPMPTATPRNPVLDLPLSQPPISLPDLPAAADVAVDSPGVVHIYGPDVQSVLFAQGYQTAKLRFFQMDEMRRNAEARISEVWGAGNLKDDIGLRTLYTTRDGRRIEEALWERLQREAPQVAGWLQAYTAGVNAWLGDLRAGRNGATLPTDYTSVFLQLRSEDLDAWRPQDSVAIAHNLAFATRTVQAWSRVGFKITTAQAIAASPDAVVRDLWRSAPATTATIVPGAAPPTALYASAAMPPAILPSLPSLPNLHSAREALARLNWLSAGPEVQGSNSWAISPALSASGAAMLAGDSHAQLSSPALRYMIHLDAGAALHVNGFAFAGLPGVVTGHNDFGAWAPSAGNFDDADIYTETVTTPAGYPAAPRTVLFRGEQVPVLRIEEPIRMRVAPNWVTKTAIIEVVPHHGPMFPDPNLDDNVVGLAATNMSVRYAIHEVTLDLPFIFDLMRARNVAEFKAAVRGYAVQGLNWLWADTRGDIAYAAAALVPQRPAGTIPYLPMPGTGAAEWLQDQAGNVLWVPPDQLPQATNPAAGFLIAANNDPVGNTLDNKPLNDQTYLGFTFDPGFRAQRIGDLLSNRTQVRPADAKMTLADMAAYQYDSVSLEAARLVPFLLAAAEHRGDLVSPAMADALQRLRVWGEAHNGSPAWNMASGVDPADFRADVPRRATPVTDQEHADAVAASIYAGWITRLGRAVFADDLPSTGLNFLADPSTEWTSGWSSDALATKALLHILEDIDRTDPAHIAYTKGPNGESTLWDDKTTPQVETRDAVLLGALRDALTFLEQQFGSGDMTDWLWGKVHQVTFRHPTDIPPNPLLGSLNLGKFPAPGGRFTVNAAHYTLDLPFDGFTFWHGAVQRFVAVLDPNGIRAVGSLAGGNNGDPGGRAVPRYYNRINPAIHYGDLIPGWLNGEVFEFRISHEAVAADAQTHLRYVPAVQ